MSDPKPNLIKTGTYRHTKSGNLYKVLGVALSTETNDQLVIYQPLYESSFQLFARPYDMFTETIIFDGEVKPRFEWLAS